MDNRSNSAAPHDTTFATPAGRKLRDWAQDRSPEIQAAADGLVQALWACANNPPSDALSAELIKRRAEFNRLTQGMR